MNGQNAVFRQFEAGLQCALRRNEQAPPNGAPWPYVDGWNSTLSIVRWVVIRPLSIVDAVMLLNL